MSPWTSASLASRSMVGPSGTAACQQLFPRDARVLRLDLRPQVLGFLCSSLQVGPDFVAVPEVERDDGVDVAQSQGIVGADHVFRPRAVLVLLDYQIQADATIADADGASFVYSKRRTLGVEGKRPGQAFRDRRRLVQDHDRVQRRIRLREFTPGGNLMVSGAPQGF